ncbi:MAG: WbqC family protein [Chitinophagaceae bacterium]|nr:WbqC family protein [Chitinophagaceae bacterium]
MNSGRQPTTFLIEANYLPPVAWFVELHSSSMVSIDIQQPFKKSTHQNRCKILGANGTQLLTVPLQGGRGVKKNIRDVKISYEERWQQIHWNSICSAYNKSSYFQFYEDQFRHFYERKTEFLIDLNVHLMQTCFRILALGVEIELVSDSNHIKTLSEKTIKINASEKLLPYYQVFQHKHGFVAGLSIIDLIFNKGPDAKSYFGNQQ